MPGHWTYTVRALAGACTMTLSFACSPPAPAPPGNADPSGADLPVIVHAHLDSAAVAYRAGDFDGARAHYTTVTDSAPDLAAAWFGLFLTHRALGNRPAADSALLRARSIAAGDSLTRSSGS